jgi:hypothetical protein
MPQRAAVIGGPIAALALIIGLVTTREPPPPPVDPAEEQAALLMQQARAAVKVEKYEEAIELIDKAEKLVPGSDVTRAWPAASWAPSGRSTRCGRCSRRGASKTRAPRWPAPRAGA